MGKAKRLKKKPPKTYPKYKMSKGEENCQPGCMIEIKKLPDIKKAKKLLKVGKEYEIQKPKKNYLNTLASVHILNEKGELMQLEWSCYRLTGRNKDGSLVPGTEIEQPKKKKKKKGK